MPGFPTFPARGECWIECNICGRARPKSESTVHYRSKKLVCHDTCNDEMTATDYMEYQKRILEREDVTPQRVRS